MSAGEAVAGPDLPGHGLQAPGSPARQENLAGLRRALPSGSPLQMALIRVLESRAAKSALGQVQPGFHDVCGHLVQH